MCTSGFHIAKNLTPARLADIYQASAVGLKDPNARTLLDPNAGRSAGTAPTGKGEQGLKSSAVNSWLARKKPGWVSPAALLAIAIDTTG